MNSRSRSLLKHALVLLVALASISFSLAAAAEDGKIEILWLGQAAMRIKTVSGKVIVIDPWLINNPRTPKGTAEEYVQAMGTSPTKTFPMKPGDKIEF